MGVLGSRRPKDERKAQEDLAKAHFEDSRAMRRLKFEKDLDVLSMLTEGASKTVFLVRSSSREIAEK